MYLFILLLFLFDIYLLFKSPLPSYNWQKLNNPNSHPPLHVSVEKEAGTEIKR